jgi:hypothetical protein
VIDNTDLAHEFERHRLRLRAIAHRMLGSQAEADDDGRSPEATPGADTWAR